MNEYFVTRLMLSVVSEPDYVGSNGRRCSPIKTSLLVLIVSIALCGIAMNLLAGSITLLGHVFWLVFHILYIGGLVYYFGKKWKQQSREA